MDSYDSTTFLRRSLQLDGVASALTGLLLLVAAGTVSSLIGLTAPGIARVVGAGLVVFAAALLWNARRTSVARGEVVAAVLLNVAWVVGRPSSSFLAPWETWRWPPSPSPSSCSHCSRSSGFAGSAPPERFAHPAAFAYHRPP